MCHQKMNKKNDLPSNSDTTKTFADSDTLIRNNLHHAVDPELWALS